MFKKITSIFMLLLMIETMSLSAKITDMEYKLMPDIFHFDDYDHCMLSNDPLYCSVTIQLFPENKTTSSKVWKLIQDISSDSHNYRHDILRYKLCVSEILNVTSTDNYSDIKINLEKKCNNKLKNMGVQGKITTMQCESKDSPYSIDIYDILFGTFIISYFLFVLTLSLYEKVVRNQGEKKFKEFRKSFIGKFIKPFSLTRNWYRLKKINWSDPDVQSLRCIQGVRFFNMVIVIGGHTFLSIMAVPVSNPSFIENMKFSSNLALVQAGRYTALTFFLISTWLLTYYFYQALEQKKQITLRQILLLMIVRLLRLIPILAVIIGIQSTWLVHLARGPLWDQVIGEGYRSCRQSWWTNLLFVNNYINNDRMCIPETWSLAVNVQYYIFIIILLRFLWNHQNKIVYVLFGILSYHVSYLFCVYYLSDWHYSGKIHPELFYNYSYQKIKTSHLIATTVSSNLGGLVAGLGYGYLYYKYKNRQLFTKKIHTVLWWILIWTLPIVSLFFPVFITLNSKFLWAVYNAVSRSIFVFGIGLGLFGVTQGLGWIMIWICERPSIYVLGRLNYAAFLFHIFVLNVRVGIKRKPIYLSSYLMFIESMENVVISYIGASVLTLFFEMPLSELQKYLLPKEYKIKQKKVEKKIK